MSMVMFRLLCRLRGVMLLGRMWGIGIMLLHRLLCWLMVMLQLLRRRHDNPRDHSGREHSRREHTLRHGRREHSGREHSRHGCMLLKHRRIVLGYMLLLMLVVRLLRVHKQVLSWLKTFCRLDCTARLQKSSGAMVATPGLSIGRHGVRSRRQRVAHIDHGGLSLIGTSLQGNSMK
jgi:hypothetical protein